MKFFDLESKVEANLGKCLPKSLKSHVVAKNKMNEVVAAYSFCVSVKYGSKSL